MRAKADRMNAATPSPFEGTAGYYARYRPGIPDSIVTYIVKRFSLPVAGRAIDLGCGTGQLTFALAPFFEEVIGLDPDPEMIAEAKRTAARRLPRCPNITWQLRPAEALETADGPFWLATMSRAFVWMDQYKVLRLLGDALEDGGGVAIIGDGSFWSGEEDWEMLVKGTVQAFLGEKRRAGAKRAFHDSGEPYTDMLDKSGYKDVLRVDFPISRSWGFSDILGYLYSTSFAAKALFGNRLSEFEAVLHKELGEPGDSTLFHERATFTVQSGLR